jgi:hypothetical protein
MAVAKYGIPLTIDVAPANRHDTKAIVPVLRELADSGFQCPALGDLGYRSKRLAEAGRHSAPSSRLLLAAETDSSFPPASAEWLNGPCLAEPLPAVEHHLRALEGALHRLCCDRVHLDRPFAALSASSSRNSAPDVYKQALRDVRLGGIESIRYLSRMTTFQEAIDTADRYPADCKGRAALEASDGHAFTGAWIAPVLITHQPPFRHTMAWPLGRPTRRHGREHSATTDGRQCWRTAPRLPKRCHATTGATVLESGLRGDGQVIADRSTGCCVEFQVQPGLPRR